MTQSRRTTERALRAELERVQARLDELEATQKAIRSGDVDAIVVEGPKGTQIYTLQSPENPYRIFAERMNEGAATMATDGTVLFCNRRLAEMLNLPAEHLVGSSFSSCLAEGEQRLRELLQRALRQDIRVEDVLLPRDGALLPVQLSLSEIVLGGSERVLCMIAADLSELKRAKEGLRDRAEVFELAHDAIVILGLDSRIQTWNRGARDLYGWSADKAVGQVGFELLRTEFPESLESIMAGLQVSKEWEGEIRQFCRDGSAVVVASRWSLLRNERGNPSAILEINRDITERKQAEEKLRTASRYARSLIEVSLDPLVTISRDGKITDVNAATEKATGISRQNLIGTDFSSYFTNPAQARHGYEQVFAEGEVRDYPLAIRSASGDVTDVLYNASVFRNETGEIEGVFAAARDVTERNRIEAARDQADQELRQLNQDLEARVDARTQELRESEQRVRQKLNSILSPEGDLEHLELADVIDTPGMQALATELHALTGIPVFMLDKNGRPLVSAGWQTICRDFHRVHPDACQNCMESDLKLSAGVEPGSFKLYKCRNHMWDVVTPIVLGDRHIGNLFSGQFFFEDEQVDRETFVEQARRFDFDEKEYLAALDRVPRLNRDRVHSAMVFYSKLAGLLSQLGYSSIKLARAMEQTNRVNAQLAVSIQDMESFAYSVSHDLRAPLRHVDGFLALLSGRCYSTLDDTSKHYIDQTLQASQRMGRLIDELLQFSRLGRAEVHKLTVNLNTIVREAIRELEPETGARRIVWNIETLPEVAADPVLLRQLVENLL
ncbi:MAG TPA: PAS domain S-box protein, partial [Acidobacteriaceae bacterium]|nr:PAS domain S-box protein [Acidobacteriaceae bacterium]